MKRTTWIAAALLCGMSAVSNAANYAAPLPGNSQGEALDRAAQLAVQKVHAGTPVGYACTAALTELHIKLPNSGVDEQHCYDELTGELAAERNARQAQEAAERQRQAEQLDDNLIHGRRAPQNLQEAAVAFNAGEGNRFASAPLLTPDKRNYWLTGIIDTTGGVSTSSFLVREAKDPSDRGRRGGMPRYFYVQMPASLTSNLASAHVGSFIELVGSYQSNSSYKTASGQGKSMPVFVARYIRVLD